MLTLLRQIIVLRLILRILSDNLRIELKKLGSQVKLTGEAVRHRIKNLIKKEVILGFSAIPNYVKLGYQTYFLLIQTRNLTTENEKRLKSFLHKKEYTILSSKMIGKYDIFISISIKNLNELNQILTELKNEFSNIIRTYETFPVLDWHKYTLFPEGIGSY